jgi:hypothetical protein
MASNVLTGRHPELGRVWAAVDPKVRFTAPGLRATRLGALLAPFPNRSDAIAAMMTAGATVEDDG